MPFVTTQLWLEAYIFLNFAIVLTLHAAVLIRPPTQTSLLAATFERARKSISLLHPLYCAALTHIALVLLVIVIGRILVTVA